MQVWRICKERFREAAFAGEGARLYPGRWNPAGLRMVYTSTSLALAAIELFVHLDPEDAPEDLISVCAAWSDDLTLDRAFMEKWDVDSLPDDWRCPEHDGLRRMGAEWIASMRSVAVMVPSVVVEGEWNVLLNPAHPGFAKVNLLPHKPFHFDRRMFSSTKGQTK